MEAAIKRQEIHFDAYRYEMSINQWNKRTELVKSIRYKLVEKKYVQNNPMHLSGIKLAELHEMDFRHLLNNQLFEYGKRLDLKKPTKADHTFYAETPEEIQRLKKVNAFIDAVKEFSGKGSFMMPEQNQIHHLTKGAVSIGRKSDLIPNVTYIKDAV